MAKVHRMKGKKGSDIEVFWERFGGKTHWFVTKITKKKMATGEARNKKHAFEWAKRLK